MTSEQRLKDLQETYAVRDEFYTRLGTVDPDVITTKVNTAATGGPVWPDLRQAWRIIRADESLIFGSDGLADPYRDVEGDNAGFGVEVYAETTDPSELSSSRPLRDSWLFHLVHDVSHSITQDQYFKFRVARDGYYAFLLRSHEQLGAFQNADGLIGALLGVPKPGVAPWAMFPMAVGMFLTIKLLLPAELEYAAKHGPKGLAHLSLLFTTSGSHHYCSLDRTSVV